MFTLFLFYYFLLLQQKQEKKKEKYCCFPLSEIEDRSPDVIFGFARVLSNIVSSLYMCTYGPTFLIIKMILESTSLYSSYLISKKVKIWKLHVI